MTRLLRASRFVARLLREVKLVNLCKTIGPRKLVMWGNLVIANAM